MLDFVTYTKPDYEPAWFHGVWCDYLDRFVAGDIRRLMVFAPPRHGKSELVSRRLPACILGRNPDAQIIACSYSADLASRMNRDVQRIIDEPAYARLFPGTRLGGANVRTLAKGTWLRNSDLFEVVGCEGVYRSSGVGGGITGMGFDCFPAGTVIQTEIGATDIATLCQLPYPPRVLSFNHRRNCLEWKRVVASRTVVASDLVEVETEGGRSFRCTRNHRVYVREQGYRQAGDLCPGDRLVAAAEAGEVSAVPSKDAKLRRRLPAVLSRTAARRDRRDVRLLRQTVRHASLSGVEGREKRPARPVLLAGLLAAAPRCQESSQVQTVSQSRHAHQDGEVLPFLPRAGRLGPAPDLAGEGLPGVRRSLSTTEPPHGLLLTLVCGRRALLSHEGGRQLTLQNGRQLREALPGDAEGRPGAGRLEVHCLWPSEQSCPDKASSAERQVYGTVDSDGAPHQRGRDEQSSVQSGGGLHLLPQEAPPPLGTWQEDAVRVVRPSRSEGEPVYDLQVEGNSNFFADGVLVHNCGIIDDPIKSQAEALSATYREKVYEWYTSTFYTRQARHGRILLTVTRWHDDDLPGRLLKHGAEDPTADRWTVLRFPAVAEAGGVSEDRRAEGEALWAERFGLDFLGNVRATMGEHQFAALYQQRPQLREGGMFKHAWFTKVVEVVPAEGRLVRYWDRAATGGGGCHTCGVLMLRTPDRRFFVVHVVRGQWSPRERDLVILQTAQADRELFPTRPPAIYVEREGGSSGIDSIESTAQLLAGFNFRGDRPTGSKEVRAEPLASQAEAGNVYLVRDPARLWNVAAYCEELCLFPFGAYSDQVDASSGAFNCLTGGGVPTVDGDLLCYPAPPPPGDDAERRRQERAAGRQAHPFLEVPEADDTSRFNLGKNPDGTDRVVEVDWRDPGLWR